MLSLDSSLVKKLIAAQFPRWAHLPLSSVEPSGWDNRTFRLGEELSVRLPSAACYAPQIEKEFAWLPYLAPLLSLTIPTPLALGEPGEGYSWKWGIYRWIEGTTAVQGPIYDLIFFAYQLGEFLKELHACDSRGGPVPGEHNFYRGGSLKVYDTETRHALELLKDELPTALLEKVWEQALASSWEKNPVWVHGDVSSSNLLVDKGTLKAVIDFGLCAIGDPACDLTIAWTFFAEESRKVFQKAVTMDPATWQRARGWALWKALIGFSKEASIAKDRSKLMLYDLLGEYHNGSTFLVA